MIRLIKLKALTKWNPLGKVGLPWSISDPILIDDVLAAIEKNETLSPDRAQHQGVTRETHIKRIAWLVNNKDNKPITISPKAHWIIKDGNHRLAAAIVRGDEEIKVNILL